MREKALSVLLHVAEALVMVFLAVCLAYFFPEHRTEIFVAAFSVFSGLAKGIRISDVIPIPDYINPPKS